MIRRAGAICVGLALLAAEGAQAQQTRPVPGDTVPRDTIRLMEPDSVMRALMDKPGYIVTRYEGGMVTFDATAKAFAIAAATLNRAIVEREGQRIVTDSAGSIVYNDQQRSVTVSGRPGQRFEIFPGEGQPPIVGVGSPGL